MGDTAGEVAAPSGTGKAPIPEPSSEAFQMDIGHVSTTEMPEVSLYEQSRELRIRENLERMQKLGIVDLSLKLKSSVPPKRNRRKSFDTKTSPPPFEIPPVRSLRRSSRLQNATPVTYSELRMEKKNKCSEDGGLMLEEGSRPEVYTEEHEKLLGSTEKTWTLFVDGYGKDGKRIYDPIKGKTCHQCRQKTLGHRTHCSRCDMVQGQFCGDCLYMRYGEHVLEAQQNPDWKCPVCRGICNCSLCRQAKGWLPTGPMYKKIARMGYKSVAHFLIQTRRPQPSSGQNPIDLASAKRSLSFTNFKVDPKGSPKVDDNLLGTMEYHVENNAVHESDNEKQNVLQSISDYDTKDPVSVKRSLSFSCHEQDTKETKPPDLNHDNDELSKLQSGNCELGEALNEKAKELHCLKRKNGDNYNSSFDECPMPEKKPNIAVETNPMDQGCSTGNDQSEIELSAAQGTASVTDQILEKKTDISSQTASESTTGQQSLEGGVFQETNDKPSEEEGVKSSSRKKTKAQAKLSTSLEQKSVSIGRVLRSRHKAI